MNIVTISQLEHDPQIVQEYVKKSAFGSNKLMYLPLAGAIMIAVFLVLIVYEEMVAEIGYTWIAIAILLMLACIAAVVVMTRASYQKLKQETDTVPLCIAQKIYGEDNGNNYYAIYSCGPKRHDAAFIADIANKIFSLSPTTKDKQEQAVNKLFQKDFIKPGEFAKQLPLSFTGGEVVWRRQFALGQLPKAAQQEIEANNQQFWVAALRPENAFLFRQYYQQDT